MQVESDMKNDRLRANASCAILVLLAFSLIYARSLTSYMLKEMMLPLLHIMRLGVTRSFSRPTVPISRCWTPYLGCYLQGRRRAPNSHDPHSSQRTSLFLFYDVVGVRLVQ